MTNFKGQYITKDDVKIAKNYLSEEELKKLNLLSSQFLDYAELQAISLNPMSMTDWIKYLDEQLSLLKMEVLPDKGSISHQQAIEKAEQEFQMYRDREMRMFESDFDKTIKQVMITPNKKSK
jgi:hypothetical protein